MPAAAPSVSDDMSRSRLESSLAAVADVVESERKEILTEIKGLSTWSWQGSWHWSTCASGAAAPIAWPALPGLQSGVAASGYAVRVPRPSASVADHYTAKTQYFLSY